MKPTRETKAVKEEPTEPETIVAEVSQNYLNGVACGLKDAPFGLAPRFEMVIEVNRQRGYTLDQWQLSRLFGGGSLNETIIAVFRRSPR